MAIIIKKPVSRNDPKIIVPTKKKVMFDVEAALEEPEILLTKEEPVSNVQFSWEKTEEKSEPKEDQTEYVRIVTTEEKPPVDWFKTVINWFVAMLVGAAAVVGGKTAYDAQNEMEKLRERNSKLERQIAEKKKDTSTPIKAGSEVKKDPVVPIGAPPDAFVRIVKTKSHYLLAQRADGKYELRTGGMVGWRLNNFGQFGWSDFARETGAIAKYSKYAIYPTEEAGLRALEIYLFNTDRYASLSINEAMIKFFSDSKEKAITIAKKISVVLNRSRTATKMRDLSADQRNKILQVILEEDRALAGETRLYENEADWKRRGF